MTVILMIAVVVVALAALGHRVTALDAAPDGLDRLAATAASTTFLSLKVIYHGGEEVVRLSTAGIARVLCPGGTFIGRMMSKRRLPVERAAARGREISPNAWLFDGEERDRQQPHYFCSGTELLALFEGFEVFSPRDAEHDKPGSWHWHLGMERS